MISFVNASWARMHILGGWGFQLFKFKSVIFCPQMPQNSCFCLCSFTPCLLQFSPVWLSALSHRQTTKSSKQRCPPCPEISQNGPYLSPSGLPPLAAHWFTNTVQTRFSVLRTTASIRPFLSACLNSRQFSYKSLFFWYIQSLSSLCTRALTWSETFLFCCTVCLEQPPLPD